MKIDSRQLAFVLGITKKDATIKILRALRLDGQNYKEIDYEFHPNISADVKIVEKHEKIDLEFAINDIRENALKRPGFRKYLLYDYPNKKIESHKTIPKTLSLPPALRSLLSEETLKEIKDYWIDHFSIEGMFIKP